MEKSLGWWLAGMTRGRSGARKLTAYNGGINGYDMSMGNECGGLDGGFVTLKVIWFEGGVDDDGEGTDFTAESREVVCSEAGEVVTVAESWLQEPGDGPVLEVVRSEVDDDSEVGWSEIVKWLWWNDGLRSASRWLDMGGTVPWLPIWWLQWSCDE
ncbi:hypothetical protein VIGAN_05120300 [Vigna angularis var. angularis]|uniref:Uncharacterized protein n=1 Tax=Vigna angularis var. angularis TaxID=157739 RepID=A0A0S3S4N8_PHAAN|nr:hypothetical protein VIGAN_05120300 [Vigna angularis var. angularis]